MGLTFIQKYLKKYYHWYLFDDIYSINKSKPNKNIVHGKKKTFYSIYLLIPHPLSKVETLEIIKKKDGIEKMGD